MKTIFSETQVSLTVSQGQLVGIVGPVGAGKSSLLAALLGESDRLDSIIEIKTGEMASLGGSARMSGSRAFLAQQPWIQNLTLRLFSLCQVDCAELY